MFYEIILDLEFTRKTVEAHIALVIAELISLGYITVERGDYFPRNGVLRFRPKHSKHGKSEPHAQDVNDSDIKEMILFLHDLPEILEKIQHKKGKAKSKA